MKLNNEKITFIVDEIEGRKGGKGGGGDARTPVESPNTLTSNSIATVVDLISEGEIEGLVGDEQGIYFDKTQYYNGSSYAFDGVSAFWVNGYPYASQDILGDSECPITNETPTENVIGGDQKITKDSGAPSPQIISATADDVRINLYVQNFQEINSSNGDILPTRARVRIEVKPDGGSYNRFYTVIFDGKRSGGQYMRSVRLKNLAAYGAGPWTVRVVRLTDDSTSSYLTNDTYWYSYTEIITRKLNYPHCALVGLRVNAKEFGNNIPQRSYHTKLLKCAIPTGYDPDAATYTDPWDGSFESSKAYTNNPAWIMYEICTNKRFGLGATLSSAAKVELYNISKYCDGSVDDGFGGYERRYTFNFQFTNQANALDLLNDIAATCATMIYHDGQSFRFAQDKPTSPTMLVNNSNVINGLFNYSSTSLEDRYNVANVTWFDIDDFCKPAVEVIENAEGIARYNRIRKADVTAIGCTSKGQAYRFGNWLLFSTLHDTDLLTYQASWDHASVTPGDVVKVLDYDYAGIKALEGRIVDADVDTITIDSPLTMVGGHTYKIDYLTPSGVLIPDITLITDAGAQTVLEFASPISADDVPQADSVFIITDVNEIEPREWRVLSNKEIEKNTYEISAVEYNSSKYAYIEDGFEFDEPPYTNLPAGSIDPPSNLTGSEYTYTEGGLQNHLFGIFLSWTHSPDPRRLYYELEWEYASSSGTWTPLATTVEDSYKFQPVSSGTYGFRVRAVANTGKSIYVSLTDYAVLADPTPIPAIEGLTVIGGSAYNEFTGRDCQIGWDAPTAASGTLKNYKVEVWTIGDSLLRTEYVPKDQTRYTYLFGYNQADNGDPLRTFKFKVYGINYYDKVGAAGTLVVSNPAPSMSGLTPTTTNLFQGTKIEWENIVPSENDGSYFKVYCDTSNPPTTEVAQVSWSTPYWIETGLGTDSYYYAQIEPYDEFGAGTKSSVSSAIEPLKVNAVDIDAELTSSITMTDSLGTTSSGLAVLYDRTIDSGGIAYTSGDWVNYNYGIEDYQDGVKIYVSTGVNVFVSYKRNDDIWYYLGGEGDHTLDSNGNMVSYATASGTAAANYLTLSAGKNTPKFPQKLVAIDMRLHLLGSATVYELVFEREVIAELVVADSLSAISANCGTLTAGTIQSNDGQTIFDLDNDYLYVKDQYDTIRVKLGKLT